MPRDAVRCFTMLTTWHWTLVDWRAKPSAKCKFSVGRFIFFGRFCGWVFPPIAWKTSLFLDIQIVGIFGFSLMNNTCSIDWIRIHRKVVAPKSVGLTITSLSGPNRSILRYNRLNQHIITRVFISLTKFFYCFFRFCRLVWNFEPYIQIYCSLFDWAMVRRCLFCCWIM